MFSGCTVLPDLGDNVPKISVSFFMTDKLKLKTYQ